MELDGVRAGLQAAVPYNNHLGLEVVEVAEGRAVVRLPEGDHLNNHVGTQHAGGLFSAGEAASGGAFIGAFAEHLGRITPLARSAEIEYTKLAKGPIDATGTLSDPAAELLAKLEADGKVEFPIDVALTNDDGETVARMTVNWHVRVNQ